MAEACGVIENISELPSIDTDCETFEVVSNETVLTVKVSSSFEAAVKMAFVLLESGKLDEGDAVVIVSSNNGNTFKFKVTKAESTPIAVELIQKVLQFPDEDDTETEIGIDTFANTKTSTQEMQISGSDLIESTLKNYFGHTSFLPLQRETIVSTMAGESVLTVAGTGGGKSLMCLLPAVLSSKVTMVVSPLKSLIDDTLIRCLNLNISACKLHIRTERVENACNYRVIFVTPECLEDGEPLREKIDELVRLNKLERIVFDEAHTISTWGSTFRPKFKTVCESLSTVDCPKMLLSAKISAKVESDVRSIFGNFKLYRTSVFRDNLYLEIIERSNKFLDQLVKFIQEMESHNNSGIVYCVLPRDVSHIHADLVKRGINAVKYHGQLSDDIKVSSQAKWMNDEVNVMVANSSFGMGINKGNVRYVVHAKLPTSVEEYFQQCGRAGRDGLPATCKLYYNYSDKNNLYQLFQSEGTAQYNDLYKLIILLENPVQCIHKGVMNHFGENPDSFVCLTKCSNCVQHGSFRITDGTSDAHKVVQAATELSDVEITCNEFLLYLAKSNQKCVSHLQGYSTFGILDKRFSSSVLIGKFLHILINMGILSEKIHKKGSRSSVSVKITLGPKAHDLIGNNIAVTKYERT